MKFKIENKQYKLKTAWEDITLRQAIELLKFDVDEKTLEKLHTEEDVDKFTSSEMEYMRKVVNYLSTPNISKLNQIDNAFIYVLYSLCSHLVFNLYNMNVETYIPRGIEEITFKKTKYYLPEVLKVNDETIVGYKERSKFVTEGNNLMNVIAEHKGKGLEALNLLAALYLKEDKDEVYDDERVAKRAELFMDLPMSVVWEVFFCIYYSYLNYVIASKVSLEFPRMPLLKRIGLTTLGLLVLPIRGLQVLWMRLKRCRSGNSVKSSATTQTRLMNKKENLKKQKNEKNDEHNKS